MLRRLRWLGGLVAVLVLGFAGVALAQSINWVSVSPIGSGGGGPVAVSDDGRFVAFRSSQALVAGDTNGETDVYVRDMQTGSLERVSVSSSGVQANDVSGGNTLDISDDGRYVLFDSAASNLVAGDTNNVVDLFVRDRQTGTTTRIVRDDGVQGTGASGEGSLSGNGRYVSFLATGFNVPSYGVSGSLRGAFVADLVSGDVERLRQSAAHSSTTSISDDGRYVALLTREFNSNDDILLIDRNDDGFVVANPRIGGATPTHRINSVSISGNGRFVTFVTRDNNLVPGDTAGTYDMFVFNANNGTVERLTSTVGTVSYTALPKLSDDGRYVAYEFQPAGANTRIAVRDRNTDTDTVVSVHDDGTLPGPNSREPAISGTGRFVAFVTNAPFDPEDSGTSADVYIVDREGTPGGGGCTHNLTDIGGNTFENDICWLAAEGITRGCNPPANTRFCPDDRVTRGQMAAFLVRALNLNETGSGFADTGGNTFENDISRLAAAGITRGCNPPTNTRFCPNDHVTRGQMAAFLVRALNLTESGDGFSDTQGHVFAGDISRLAEAGITRGCNPPSNTRFCPDEPVTRGQMAAFLRRALG